MMRRLSQNGLALTIALVCCTGPAAAQSAPPPGIEPSQAASNDAFLLAPPPEPRPIVVRALFEIRNIIEIDDGEETFTFSGVLMTTWNDPRQSFAPAVAGTDEKVYQGNYQFNEVSPGWYPQMVLDNESGLYQKSGVVLRVQPDGTSTLTETITASAKVDLDMRRFPFDGHRLEAVFEVLGFDRDEVLLEVGSARAGPILVQHVRIPQWNFRGSGMSIRDRSVSHAGHQGISSSFVVSMDVERGSLHVMRLVIVPLIVIVLLSFSVFWMDRSSLGDRISVSFIGILTGVAYQMVISDNMPPISYFTLVHGFLNLSFATMCGTVVINLVVGALDKKGEQVRGDRIDYVCRRVFPLVYFGLNAVMVTVAFLFF